MKSLVSDFLVFLSAASILSVGADQICDFCPEPGILNTDDTYCKELLRLSRAGSLYRDQEECGFNIPILAKRCKCSAPPASPYEPCDPCADVTSDTSTTISNPLGKVDFHKSEYLCAEMLYSARNGGLSPSECEAISTSEITSKCGGCIQTEVCDADQTLCRPNQILVASNPHNHPGISNLFSTAITCEELIQGARYGSLLSTRGCNTFKSSIGAAFQPGVIGLSLFDLKACGLQCNYHESEPVGIITGGVLSGRSEGLSSDTSETRNGAPSLVSSKSHKNVSLGSGSESCLSCDFENDSAFYLYKDFGKAGTTFFEALSAPDHRADCKEQDDQCSPKEPLYPDLDNCYLADVTSFDDLIEIQAVIPPQKAAYVAVFKDTLSQFQEAKGCNESGMVNSECQVENYKHNLIYGTENSNNSNDGVVALSDEYVCPGLKEGWVNFGSNVPVPSNLWTNGQPSYCYSGPIQNAAAVWPVHQTGSNYGDMRDVNAGWKLTGGVYKCCKSLHTCAVSLSED